MSTIYIVSFCQALAYEGGAEILHHFIFKATTESEVVEKAIKYLHEEEIIQEIPDDLLFNFASLKTLAKLNNSDSQVCCSFKFEQL